MDVVSEQLLSLIRGKIPQEPRWEEIFSAANKHGIAAFLWDIVEPAVNDGSVEIPQELLRQWAALAIGYEQRYFKYERTISKLAQFYAKHGIKLMILKGYGLSLNYPVPNHRPCGDIDTYNFGEYKKADKALSEETGIKIDNSHHHHTVFSVGGFSVENHYDFVNVYAHKSSVEVEARLKSLVEPTEMVKTAYGVDIYLPSPQFNALFLLSHSASHFASSEMNLRQLLDWAFFVKKYGGDVDWDALQADCRRWNRIKFLDAINSICVDYLGFDSTAFPVFRLDKTLEDKVFEEILSPSFGTKSPNGFVRDWLFRIKRWRGNRWKQEIVYPEKALPSFIRLAWSHLIKPESL